MIENHKDRLSQYGGHNSPDNKVRGANMGAHLGPTGPRWAPCWPHDLCYLGQGKIWVLFCEHKLWLMGQNWAKSHYTTVDISQFIFINENLWTLLTWVTEICEQ